MGTVPRAVASGPMAGSTPSSVSLSGSSCSARRQQGQKVMSDAKHTAASVLCTYFQMVAVCKKPGLWLYCNMLCRTFSLIEWLLC